MNAKNFALIGAAGYIAPRHMRAIQDTGNNLIAALDPSDSVGQLDQFGYDVAFFTEFERFDRYAEKLRRAKADTKIDYVSICSPNYLHDAHIRFALRIGADAICEKPIVINPWNVDALAELERESGNRVYTVLQLRTHPNIIALREKIRNTDLDKKYDIDLTYITSRGRWYFTSWKGDIYKSGGIATNIGVHFFDMLLWIFGDVRRHEVHLSTPEKMSGYLELEKANVRWFLSVDHHDLPEVALAKKQSTYRSITYDGKEIDFTGGFTDLHTAVYQDIMAGGGYGMIDARPAIDLVYQLRQAEIQPQSTNLHPCLGDKRPKGTN
ncbi:Gfo/Idh/MocA family oxidoreductase [Pelovirga terrestris]|uniref:Gfo/Idh/MocA family oxidoreductase n=1 Tax=Pelovirga terrestris TaxID=2771352 RepID=A0A8J6QW75_9BACT|nr:Gfo/Idh/MocA family oxidoreductase [Pelovirga terrestris]MBD1399621.1 Gfo/Idh/MocA family oxidoreductase [Pelovirga terrestris]